MSKRLRNFTRISFLVLLLAVIVPFTLPLKGSRPLISLDSLKMPRLGLPEVEVPEVVKEEEPAVRTAYRWKDQWGSWQYSSEPPAGDVPYETLVLDPDANVMRAVEAEPSEAPQSAQVEGVDGGKDDGLPISLSPQKMQKLVEDAKAVEQTLQQRKAAQDRIIDSGS